MERRQLDTLFEDIWAAYCDVVDAAGQLTNAQLESRAPFFGGREIAVRNLLYLMVTHPREHTVHLSKVLQQTGAPGAQPTEAQLILGEIAESLGSLRSLGARMTDADLDRQFEGQSARQVLEHVSSTQRGYVQRLRAFLQGTPAPAAP